MSPLAVVHPMSVFLVAMGGACGCVLRFLAVNQVIRFNPTVFPLGAMVVNVVGSLLIGVVLAKYGSEHSVRAFFVTGLLGGFTTFSAFSWDAMQLMLRGQTPQAIGYVVGSVLLSIAAASLGFYLVRP